MKITNKGNASAYLLLLGQPVVTDNLGGGQRALSDVSGVARCGPFISGSPDSVCYGSPQDRAGETFPLQAFTLLEPGIETTVNLRFERGTSSGPLISMSANLACRLVNDLGKDATLTDAEKYKQFRVMSLSFPPVSVTEGK